MLWALPQNTKHFRTLRPIPAGIPNGLGLPTPFAGPMAQTSSFAPLLGRYV